MSDQHSVETAEAGAREESRRTIPASVEIPTLLEQYKIIADWIRFADAKAAVLLGVQGVLVGLFVPISTTYYQRFVSGELASKPWASLVLGCDALWFGLFLISTVLALLCIVPHGSRGRHKAFGRCNHFHPAAIALCYNEAGEESFVRDYLDLGPERLKKEILLGIFIDAFICSNKYRFVVLSTKLFAAELLIGFVFYVVSRL
jgi:hypothetical protein